MSIRQRTLIFIGSAMVGLIILLAIFSQILITNSYIDLETNNVNQNLQRIQNAFTNEIAVVNALTRDWANWDTAYSFGLGEADDFIESELADDIISNIGMSLIIFIDADREPLYAIAFDREEETSTPLDASIYDQLVGLMLDESQPLTDVTSGIVILDGVPYIVSTKPLLTSRFEPPASGALLFGRPLDDERLASFRASLDLDFDLIVTSSTLTAERQFIVDQLEGDGATLVQPQNDNQVDGFRLIDDLDETQSLLVHLIMPRDVYQQGQATLRTFFTFLIIISVIVGGLIILLMERLVLSRLGRLSEQVNGITPENYATVRINLQGTDEIGQLSEQINGMLTRIEDANVTIKQSFKTIDERTRQLKRTQALLNTTVEQIDDAFNRDAHPDEIRDYLRFAKKQIQDDD